MSDPIDMVRQVVPPVEAPPKLLERVRSDLMTTIAESGTPSEATDTERRPRRRRRWAVPIAAAAVLATGGSAAAGWAMFSGGDTSLTTNAGCPTPDGEDATMIVNAVTGDPVADCRLAWRETYGSEPPAMTAYDNGNGGVHVLIDGWSVPDGYVALEPGPHQDGVVIELEAALADAGEGLTSNCFDEEGARSVARRELDRLGLTDWTITVDESRPPTGAASCAYAALIPEQQEVQLIGMGPAPAEADPYTIFARELADRLSSECLDLDAAAGIAREVASNTDVSALTDVEFTEEAGLLKIRTVEDSSATCTRVDVEFGGAAFVTLRGPAS